MSRLSAKLSPPWTCVLENWRQHNLKIVTSRGSARKRRNTGTRKKRKRSEERTEEESDDDDAREDELQLINDLSSAVAVPGGSTASTSSVSYKYLFSGSSTALAASAMPAATEAFDDDENQSDADGEDEDKDIDEPTVRSCFRPLLRMMRPSNFPGVILFHVLGVHRALSTGLASSTIPMSYSPALLFETLRRPQMIIVTLALLLTSATSMVVNDY